MLKDFVTYKNRQNEVIIYDRTIYEAPPRGPKGQPLVVFPCSDRDEQEALARAFNILKAGLVFHDAGGTTGHHVGDPNRFSASGLALEDG